DDTTNTVIFDANRLQGKCFLRLNPGLNHAIVRNNLFHTLIANKEGAPAYAVFVKAEKNRLQNNVVRDVWIVNNTFVDPPAGAGFFRFNVPSGTDPDTTEQYIRARNIHLANNLVATKDASATGSFKPVSLDALPAYVPNT